MKAISLWQPWATLMALGEKQIETRSWAAPFSGELAICSAKKFNAECRAIAAADPFRMVLEVNGMISKHGLGIIPEPLPLGFVLCVVDLKDCYPTRAFEGVSARAGIYLSAREAAFGDFTPGRFAWMTENCRRLKEPVPVIGRQGLFELPADVEALVRAQL